VKWSGATGPQNVFFANTMTKQTAKGGPYVPFYGGSAHTVYQFGWDGAGYRHLTRDDRPIEDWAGNELADFGSGNGVDRSLTEPADSLFLQKVR
jgi:hypothetical protein